MSIETITKMGADYKISDMSLAEWGRKEIQRTTIRIMSFMKCLPLKLIMSASPWVVFRR